MSTKRMTKSTTYLSQLTPWQKWMTRGGFDDDDLPRKVCHLWPRGACALVNWQEWQQSAHCLDL